MKKFTYLFAALSMMAVSANAQQISNDDFTAAEFGGELVSIVNPSFEEYDGEDSSAAGVHLKGWSTQSTSTWDGKSQKSMPENTHGAWYARCVETASAVAAPARIYQTVTGKGASAYVLSASVCVTRNGQKGNIDALNGIFGYLYVMDNEDLDFGPEKYMKIGECLATMPRKYLVYSAEVGETLEIGFGLPQESNDNPKGWLQCDAFKLEYVAGKTVAEVQALVDAKTTGINAIQTVAEKNKGAIYNLAGQRVNSDAKGLLIKNGKKFIVR